MSLNRNDFQAMQRALENNFLYRNDEDSLHVLLSLLENEYRVHQLKPKYTCMRAVARSIRRVLRSRQDAKEIVATLTRVLREEINRLEFAVYLEGYSLGYQDKEWTDRLEMATLDHVPVEELYQMKYLFHHRLNSDILVLKNRLMDEIEEHTPNYRRLSALTGTYCEKKIHRKIMRLNTYRDKQLMLWQDERMEQTGVREPAILVTWELERIYERVVRAYAKSIQKLFKEAYWHGLNDRVISRY